MGAFTTRRLVEFRDTDAAGIAHFSAFFFWMESAEHELLRSLGRSIVERTPEGVDASWPRVAASCEYTAAVRFGDELDVAVTVERIGRASITYGFRFTHAGAAVAHGSVTAVRCLMHPGRKPEPVPIPDDLAGRLAAFASAAVPGR